MRLSSALSEFILVNCTCVTLSPGLPSVDRDQQQRLWVKIVGDRWLWPSQAICYSSPCLADLAWKEDLCSGGEVEVESATSWCQIPSAVLLPQVSFLNENNGAYWPRSFGWHCNQIHAHAQHACGGVLARQVQHTATVAVIVPRSVVRLELLAWDLRIRPFHQALAPAAIREVH